MRYRGLATRCAVSWLGAALQGFVLCSPSALVHWWSLFALGLGSLARSPSVLGFSPKSARLHSPSLINPNVLFYFSKGHETANSEPESLLRYTARNPLKQLGCAGAHGSRSGTTFANFHSVKKVREKRPTVIGGKCNHKYTQEKEAMAQMPLLSAPFVKDLCSVTKNEICPWVKDLCNRVIKNEIRLSVSVLFSHIPLQ